MKFIESKIRFVSPGKAGILTGEYGEPVKPPKGWAFLPAGDAGITRKVTAKGEYWRVQYKKGRRTISKGIWAPETTIQQAKQTVTDVRATDEYKKKQVYAIKRREKKQEEYDAAFCKAVEGYLNFHGRYKTMEQKLAKAVTEHAIPVGSGTVARTQLTPIEERAARTVIAWMRHKTTAYDNLKIANRKGERRAVRRTLAQQSVVLLSAYRRGNEIKENCLLQKAMEKIL
jgi:hypothetical protein